MADVIDGGTQIDEATGKPITSERKRLLGVHEVFGRGLLSAVYEHLNHELDFDFDMEHDSTYNLKEAIGMLDSGKYHACLITSFAISTEDIDPKTYPLKDVRYSPRRFAGLHLIEYATSKGIPALIETANDAWNLGDRFHIALIQKVRELGGVIFNSRDWNQGGNELAFETFLNGFRNVFPRKK